MARGVVRSFMMTGLSFLYLMLFYVLCSRVLSRRGLPFLGRRCSGVVFPCFVALSCGHVFFRGCCVMPRARAGVGIVFLVLAVVFWWSRGLSFVRFGCF